MALTLNSTKVARAATLAAVLAAALPRAALALGPNAPFAPPRAAAAASASVASATSTPASPSTAPAALAASAGERASEAAAPGAGLSGIHLGPWPAALIDGQWCHVGQQVRGARVQSIDGQGATLAHADGRIETLSLMPAAALRLRPPGAKPNSKAVAS